MSQKFAMPIHRHQRIPRTATGREQEAIALVLAGVSSYRAAGDRYRIAKSTLYDKVKRRRDESITPPKSRGRKLALTEQEESIIVELLCKYSDKGVPLSRNHLTEACALLIQSMPLERRRALPFKDGVPGARFVRNFLSRHKNVLRFSKPLRQEAQRYDAVSADVLVEHFAQLETVIERHNIDSTRIWNLDECGGTPGRDVVGNTESYRIFRRNGERDYKLPEFVRTNRITLMPVISGSGDIGPPLYVFKGVFLPYRTVLQHGEKVQQTYHSVLPRGSVVSMREQNGGVDSNNFYEWAKLFVNHVKDLTFGGRKVLLTYDGYRSHMSLRTLELFSSNNIEVYALPAHSSGKTQPLDVVLFSCYKSNLNNLLDTVSNVGNSKVLDEFDYCSLMKEAYYKTFTRENIKSSFLRSGVWPCNPERLMHVPRPKTDGTIASVEMLEKMMNERRQSIRREILGAHTTVLQSGFVSTKKGAVLTAPLALEFARKSAEKHVAKKQEREMNERKRELRKERNDRKLRAEIAIHEEARWKIRAYYAKRDPVEFRASVRSLKERRAVAKIRTIGRRCI